MFSQEYYERVPHVALVLRRTGPVHRAELDNGLPVWVVVGYEDARRLLLDDRLGKGVEDLRRIMLGKLGGVPEEAGMFRRHMLFADGKLHGRLRGVLAPRFTAGRVRGMAPWVRELARARVEELASVAGVVDLVAEFAFPFPLSVIGRLIGVREEDHGLFRVWTEGLMEDAPEHTVPASRAMAAYFTDLIARCRRGDAGDSLLRELVVEGELDEEELISTLFLLVVAGHETSTHMISSGVRWLLEDRARWERLGEQPGEIPRVVEELLRFDSPVAHATHRFTREPVTVGGVTIPAGEIVLVSLMAANRDGARFPAPEVLDEGRDTRGHLAFGHGPHYCLGASLARLEGAIAVRLLSERFPRARLAVPPGGLRRTTSSITSGYRSLPVSLGG